MEVPNLLTERRIQVRTFREQSGNHCRRYLVAGGSVHERFSLLPRAACSRPSARTVRICGVRISTTKLAGKHQLEGDPAAAEELYRDALSILEKHPDDGADVRARVLGGLGLFRAREGRIDEAREILEKALASASAALGERDNDTASLKSCLGQIYIMQRRAPDAEPLLKDAVEIQRAGHASVADRVVSEAALVRPTCRRAAIPRLSRFCNRRLKRLANWVSRIRHTAVHWRRSRIYTEWRASRRGWNHCCGKRRRSLPPHSAPSLPGWGRSCWTGASKP